jgi:hypothetical protein
VRALGPVCLVAASLPVPPKPELRNRRPLSLCHHQSPPQPFRSGFQYARHSPKLPPGFR